MRAKDFKVGWTVRVIEGTPCRRTGGLSNVGVVVADEDGSDLYVNVKFADDSFHWLYQADELEAVKPKLPTVTDDLRLTPQAKKVLRHLKKHSHISPAEAYVVHGISRLASCIHEIRNRAGYDVEMQMKKDDAGHKYANYKLATVH